MTDAALNAHSRNDDDPPVSGLTDVQEERSGVEELIAIMARLRGENGCPWDREQTFDSIKRHTLEETYEVFDAIDRRDWPALKDELGDLLLQILFYSQLAKEAGHFSFRDVTDNLNAKLIRRHPHVFGDAQASTPEEVDRTWQAVKLQERTSRGESAGRHHLDTVPSHLPAALEAEKLGARAAEVGFDWPGVDGLFAKLAEEAEELRDEVEASRKAEDDRGEAIRGELGDLLFTAVNLARHLHESHEFALRAANRKFRRRFNRMEELAGGAGALSASDPARLEALWGEVKQEE